MTTLRAWIIASWIAFPAVMAGGTLLLRRIALGDPSEFQVTWLRAFHAHGGVLFVLSLLYFLFLERTALSTRVKHLSCVAFFVGIGGVATGFLIQGVIGQPHQASIGVAVVVSGAALLAAAIILQVYGLITVQPASEGAAHASR